MRGSLQDQLLKSGIATEEQLKKPKPKIKPVSKSRKSHSKSNAKTNNKPSQASRVQQNAQQNKQPKQKTAEEAPTLGKALRTEIKQLLKTNKLNDKTGEIPYNYVIAGQVKRFYINEKQQIELKAGKMVIVNWNTISYLITTEAEVELRKLHPTIEVASVISETESAKTQDKKKDENDPYSDYEIPDDLSW